jgi:hypothetical protein
MSPHEAIESERQQRDIRNIKNIKRHLSFHSNSVILSGLPRRTLRSDQIGKTAKKIAATMEDG